MFQRLTASIREFIEGVRGELKKVSFPTRDGNDRRHYGRDCVLHPHVFLSVDDGFRAGLADAQDHLVAWCGWTGAALPDDTMLDVQLRGDDEQ